MLVIIKYLEKNKYFNNLEKYIFKIKKYVKDGIYIKKHIV